MSQSSAPAEIYAESRDDVREKTTPAALLSVPVTVAISVGRARATIEELLALGPNSILTLDSKIEDPVELLVGERVIARARLVEIGDSGAFGVEIIALADAEMRS